MPNDTHQFSNILATNKGKIKEKLTKSSLTNKETIFDSKQAISFIDKTIVPKFLDFSNPRSSWVLWDKFDWKGIWKFENVKIERKAKLDKGYLEVSRTKKRKFSEYHHDAKQPSFAILSRIQENWR